jgi:hypothetical protein
MSALQPNDLAFGNATLCHVCHKPVDESDFAVEHDGHVGLRTQTMNEEGPGYILMHAECATVLAMRLIHDAMKQTVRTEQTPLRAVEVLNRNRSKKS